MRLKLATIAAVLCVGGAALAQAPASQLPPAPTAHHRSAPAAPSTPAAQSAPAAQPKTEAPATPATKSVDPAKAAAIRHLMDITQSSKLGDNMASYISNEVRRYLTQSMDSTTLPKFMDTFNAKFAASAPSKSVTDAMVPIYDRAFTKEQIDGLVQFYESPLGQHVVQVLPQVLQESQDAAAKMDQEAALNVLRDMSGEYPQLKQILPDQNQAAPQEGTTPSAPKAAPQAAPQTAPPAPPPQK